MDQAYHAIGENGPFQKITILIVSLGALLATIYPLSYSYLTKLPSFFCHDNSSPNSTIYECKCTKDLCNSNIEMVKNPKKSVINWAYDFDLYCSRDYYNDIISSSFFIGAIIGSTTLATLPDKYGRQKIFQILLCLSCFLHFNMFLIQGPFHMIIIFFFGGFFSFVYGMCFCIVSEYLPSSISGTVMGIVNALYPSGGIIIGVFFMYINQWRMLYFLLFILHLGITYLTLRYFTESPIWLNAKGRKDECIQTLEKIAILNGQIPSWEDYQKSNLDLLREDSDINKKDKNHKNILFEITDQELLNRTGGVVQGMSGSPIIQGDYIIGAVTHVVVDNPTKGYGIFITSMLEEGEN